MSDFMPKKVYLPGILLYYFIRKKSRAEAHRTLVETYSDYTLPETTCRDWFRCLNNNDFMLKIKNALVHRKSLNTKNWKYYFIKTHVRHKKN